MWFGLIIYVHGIQWLHLYHMPYCLTMYTLNSEYNYIKRLRAMVMSMYMSFPIQLDLLGHYIILTNSILLLPII